MEFIYSWLGFLVFWICIISICLKILNTFQELNKSSNVWVEDENGKKFWATKRFFIFSNSCKISTLEKRLKTHPQWFIPMEKNKKEL